MGTHADRTNISSIVTQLIAGSEAAFDHIYTLFSRKVYQVAYRILNSEEEALDVVQETFLKLWLRRSEIQPDKSIDAYLSVIARHYALKLLRARLQASVLEGVQERLQAEDTDLPLLRQEFQDKLWAIITQLPPRAREVLLLSRKDGLSNQEIADRLGLSLSTVNNHIHLALSRIRESLALPLTLISCLLLS
ncbi:MAG: RNA polymerase sigma-70 factor [Bacteroidia bacterium]|jgi:RNA polymerase sigma-70 factor (ECF subfamily)|nr:RNA polymerase sigma-70 factor [Bacteroidia bacterium]